MNKLYKTSTAIKGYRPGKAGIPVKAWFSRGAASAANKVKGVRAAVCYNMFTAILSRDHNDANVFCTGAWIIDHDKAGEVVLQWLEMGYSGVHGAKIDKIKTIEG